MQVASWLKSSPRPLVVAIGAALMAVVGGLILSSVETLNRVQALSYSQAVLDQNRSLLRLTLNEEQLFRLPIDLSTLPSYIKQSFMAREDQWFYFHPGVNPWATVRAAYLTYVKQQRRVGGSTITMQVARRLWHLRTTTVAGKIKQMWFALALEVGLSKHEILALYLDLIPFGGNIEGIEAASQFYFGKFAASLTLNEAISLVVIPQNPNQFNPRDDNMKYLAARGAFLKRWQTLHPNSCRYCDEPPTVKARPGFPFLAPHYTDFVLTAGDEKESSWLHTTLDSVLQDAAETMVKQYVLRRKAMGIQNAAAMIVDARSMTIKAMVGSANFFDSNISGQVNGVNAKRSPGSTLKPFVYALGFDQGLIHPSSLLKDAPASFAAFTPENSDGDFDGPIDVRTALVRSRNVPAVDIMAKLSDPGLYDFLSAYGVAGLKDFDHYGLSLILGGAELTMLELVQLYGILVIQGRFRQLALFSDQRMPAVKSLSEEAAFVTKNLLLNQPRPGRRIVRSEIDDQGQLFWKTGTSAGFKDAWSVGGFGRYLLAVWVGNFDGQGNRAFTGRSAAVPLFLNLVDSIVSRSHELPGGATKALVQSAPSGIVETKVCSVSGMIPGLHCQSKKPTFFIPGVSPITRCNVHRAAEVDVATGYQLCPRCRRGRARSEHVFEYWSSDLLRLFELAGLKRTHPPRHNPDCVATMVGVKPKILSPKRGLVYLLQDSEADGRDEMAFEAVADSDVATISWFVNREFLGTAKQGEKIYWHPRPGRFEVRAIDDQGRSAARTIKVARAGY